MHYSPRAPLAGDEGVGREKLLVHFSLIFPLSLPSGASLGTAGAQPLSSSDILTLQVATGPWRGEGGSCMSPGSVRGQGTYSEPLPVVIYLGFQNVAFSRVQLLSVTNSLY